MKTPKILLLIILCSILQFACGRIHNYPSLANQGMLPLSANNPYLGSNLFLADELSQSTYLFNFFRHRGAPTAIELIDRGTIDPVKMLLFYPRQKEVYTADRQEFQAFADGPIQSEWVVRGPYPIDRRDYSALAGLESSFNAEPKFIIHGKPYQFRFYQEQVARQVIKPVAPPPPPPQPVRKASKPAKKNVVKAQIPIESAGLPKDPKEFRPMNSDQLALYMSQGYAERDANGDLIHTVTKDSQTLTEIAKWYTGSAENAESIQKQNSLDSNNTPPLGTRVRIPKDLVKEFKQLN
ncbi:MAG: hypothetical protein KDD56_09730 [Bdellovibrionales bacterium]|nr:hypothetical protein [Bdellovibrionales bacterium]